MNILNVRKSFET